MLTGQRIQPFFPNFQLSLLSISVSTEPTKNMICVCLTRILSNLNSPLLVLNQRRYTLRVGFATATWVKDLRKRFPQGAIAICTEQKRGPLIYALCKYDFLVIHPVNPHTVAKYRQAFAPSRAKADPTDARILVELLLKHPDQLQAWQPGSAQLRSLQHLVESRRTLVAEKVRLTNRLTAALKSDYP
jgi:Transposase